MKWNALMVVGMLASVVVDPQLGLAEKNHTHLSMQDAMRDATIAEISLKLHDRVDYALRSRRLRSEIQIAEAERDSLKRLVRKLGPSNRHNTHLLRAIENAQLDLLRAELRVKDLRYERGLMEQFKGSQRRLYRLALQRANQQIYRMRFGDLRAVDTSTETPSVQIDKAR